MWKFYSSNWIITTVKYIETVLRNKGQFENVKFVETVMHINTKNSNIDSFSIRLEVQQIIALFLSESIIKKFIILENKNKGKIKGKIVIKEEPLLSIMKIVSNLKQFGK